MYSNSGFSEIPDDLRNQDRESTRRRLEAAPSSEVIKWAIASIRDHTSRLTSLEKEHKRLTKEASIASVELRRLKSLSASDSGRVSYLRDMHRKTISSSKGIARTLNSCMQAIKEAVTNYQLIRQTLNSPLADHEKKIAAQQRLSSSIKDLDDKIAKCSKEVETQKRLGDQLSQAISQLLNKHKSQLPNHERERIEQEDKVAKIALDYQRPQPRPQPNLIAKNVSLGNNESGIGIPALAAIAIGVFIGMRLWK